MNSATARFAVCQPTPNSAAAAATDIPSTLTIAANQQRARPVIDTRWLISSTCSDHVFTAQTGSGQLHRRRANTNTVARPAIGRSRTTDRTRP